MMRDVGRYRKANPVQLTRILNTLVDDLGIAPDIFLKKLKEHWHDIVGTTNARNTRPVALDKGVLIVTVSSPAWNTQARYYKSSFLQKVNEYDPESGIDVRDIRFTLERQ